MTSQPPSKSARLASLRQRLPYVSQAALAALLREAQHGGLPEVTSKQSIRRARAQFVQQRTPYGELHRKLRINDTECYVQNPHAFLWHAVRSSSALSNLITHTASASPPTRARPWRIVLYFDEVAPGNQLAYANTRKLWCAYWSFLEFGASSLGKEDTRNHGAQLCTQRSNEHGPRTAHSNNARHMMRSTQ